MWHQNGYFKVRTDCTDYTVYTEYRHFAAVSWTISVGFILGRHDMVVGSWYTLSDYTSDPGLPVH